MLPKDFNFSVFCLLDLTETRKGENVSFCHFRKFYSGSFHKNSNKLVEVFEKLASFTIRND